MVKLLPQEHLSCGWPEIGSYMEGRMHEGKEKSIGVHAVLNLLYLNESRLYAHKHAGIHIDTFMHIHTHALH